MGPTFFDQSRSNCSRVLVGVAVASAAFIGVSCRAADESLPTPPQTDAPQFKARSNMPPGMPSHVRYGGGVFEESYFRGLQRPMTSYIEQGGIPQATGWTSYGFPARPFRWGYFGAEPRNPRTSWHRKYYGDKVKTKYYNGY